MRDKRLRELFREQECICKPDEKQERMYRIEQAIRDKQIRYRPKRTAILWLQLRYMEKSYWLAQFLLLAFILVLFIGSAVYAGGAGQAADAESWREWRTAKAVLAVSSCVAAFIGMSGVLGLHRLVSYHMQELMETLYFNLGQLASIRMAIYSAVDLAFLAVLLTGIDLCTRIPVLVAAVYLLLPFILSNLCYFSVFSFVRGRGRTIAFAAVAFFSAIAGIVMADACSRCLYTETWRVVLLLSAFAAGLLFEMRYVLRRITNVDEAGFVMH